MSLPVLKLRRSQPQGDKPVLVEFIDNEGNTFGRGAFPALYWRHFHKILLNGIEQNQKQAYVQPLKIVVEGFVPPTIESVGGVPVPVEGVDRLTRTLKVEE